MTNDNFFDKFWIPYLEYEAALGYCGLLMRAEVDNLEIQPKDKVINVGINWGDSLIYLTEQFPKTNRVIGVDSSTTMIDLSMNVLSKDELPPTLREKISDRAIKFLENLHSTAQQYQHTVELYHCSAEDLDSLGIKANKIAATMGLHWLTNPERAFAAFNRSLETNGVITFTTASSRFEVVQKDLLFHQNPYYQHFLDAFAELYNTAYRLERETTKARAFKRRSYGEVLSLVEENGFRLEQYREYPIKVSEKEIDEVCIAGIKFRYDFDGRDEAIAKITKEALVTAKRKFNYSSSIKQYELSPIFKIRKVKEV